MEALGITEARWRELYMFLIVLAKTERTPAKILLALETVKEITEREKMVMIYALAYQHISEIIKPSKSGIVVMQTQHNN